MIIGTGLIASAFASHSDDENTLIFASGVSNSLCCDDIEYKREFSLLSRTLLAHPDKKFVYFSTCSIADSDRCQTHYVKHKIQIENYVRSHSKNFIILRLPAVIGQTNAASTLPFVFAKKIRTQESFKVWKEAIRYPIDVEDVVSLTRAFLNDPNYAGTTVNVAAYPHKVVDIVKIMERILQIKAKYEVVSKGSSFTLDLQSCYSKAEALGIKLDIFYLERVLRKYWSQSGYQFEQDLELPAALGGERIRKDEPAILFGAPVISEKDIQSVSDCLRSRWIGKGPITKKFEQEFAKFKQTEDAVAVNSCTAGLHLALLTLGVKANDEVIVPTMTFCATSQAVELVGASPVFVDCEPSTFNINAELIKPHISQKTKAIIVVHIAGRCVDMDPIMALAREHNLVVIEDCAHALESHYKNVPTGMIGDAGCFSFYATKSVTTGDGGMVIMRDSQNLAKLRLLSNHGMTTDAWLRVNSNVSNYDVVSPGYKYNMTDMEAALGLSQFLQIHTKREKRRHLWYLYHRTLQNLPIQLPQIPESDEAMSFHLFSVVLEDSVQLDASGVMAALKYELIGTGVHYHPLHAHHYYKVKYSLESTQFGNASKMICRLLSLPLNTDLKDSDILKICETLKRILYCFKEV